MAALPAVARPHLTVLPGGRRRITLPLADVEEAWVETQAVAADAIEVAGIGLGAARLIQEDLVAGRILRAARRAHDLEQTLSARGSRAQLARARAAAALARLQPEPVA